MLNVWSAEATIVRALSKTKEPENPLYKCNPLLQIHDVFKIPMEQMMVYCDDHHCSEPGKDQVEPTVWVGSKAAAWAGCCAGACMTGTMRADGILWSSLL